MSAARWLCGLGSPFTCDRRLKYFFVSDEGYEMNPRLRVIGYEKSVGMFCNLSEFES